jgi:phage shock protein A
MMKGNENVSVLTTYADVDSIISKTSSDDAYENLERMEKNIYS